MRPEIATAQEMLRIVRFMIDVLRRLSSDVAARRNAACAASPGGCDGRRAHCEDRQSRARARRSRTRQVLGERDQAAAPSCDERARLLLHRRSVPRALPGLDLPLRLHRVLA
jgi:hypothetical protein